MLSLLFSNQVIDALKILLIPYHSRVTFWLNTTCSCRLLTCYIRLFLPSTNVGRVFWILTILMLLIFIALLQLGCKLNPIKLYHFILRSISCKCLTNHLVLIWRKQKWVQFGWSILFAKTSLAAYKFCKEFHFYRSFHYYHLGSMQVLFIRVFIPLFHLSLNLIANSESNQLKYSISHGSIHWLGLKKRENLGKGIILVRLCCNQLVTFMSIACTPK